MASYVKFELEDGTIVYVESTDAPKGASGFPLTSRGESPTDQPAVPFQQSIQSIRKMAAAVMDEMRAGFTQAPDEVQVNFGVKASAEIGGLVVSRGGMEANYNVMLRWNSKDKAGASDSKKEKPAQED